MLKWKIRRLKNLCLRREGLGWEKPMEYVKKEKTGAKTLTQPNINGMEGRQKK